MSTFRTACLIMTASVLFYEPALSQTAATPQQHVPLQQTIGQGATRVVPSLIVMNARGASLQGGKLTLTGVAANSILFADRPVRAAGHAVTADLLREWSQANENSDSFAKDPPNATVSGFSKDGSIIRDAVVVLKTPKLDGDRLTFDVDLLEGDLAGADGPASIFIDRFGFGGFHVGTAGGFHASGFHAGGFDRVGVGRVGYAGVGYRPVYRGAWYAGAAGVGAAAVGAAALGATTAAAVAAPYYGAACGYYPYPPCY